MATYGFEVKIAANKSKYSILFDQWLIVFTLIALVWLIVLNTNLHIFDYSQSVQV